MSKQRILVLVEKKVQGALGLRIVAHWFIFLAMSILVTCTLRTFGSIEHPSVWNAVRSALLEQTGSIVVLLALLPWFVHDALKLSNRFAGPMVRLRKSIRQLTNGEELPPVKFREDDFWQDLAEEFNLLRIQVLEERKRLAALLEHSQEMPVSTVPILMLDALPVATSAPFIK